MLNGLIKGRAHDLGVDGTVHIGDLLRTLTDQHHHQVHIRMVGRYAVSHFLEDRGLACLGWGYDQPTLAKSNGRHHFQQPLRHHTRAGVEGEGPIGEDRCEPLEMRPLLGQLRVHPIHSLDAQQAAVFLSILGRAHLSGDHIATAQAETTDLALRHVDVFAARCITRRAQEPDTFIGNL